MKASNIFGMAFHFMPRDLSARSSDTEIRRGENIVTQNNVIYLMTGVMPDTDTLYDINNMDEFEAAYGSQQISKFEDNEFTYYYDRLKKIRTIQKTVDALNFTHDVDGAVTWFAVKMTDVDGVQYAEDGVTEEQTFIFSDSVGTWLDTDRAMVLSNKESQVAGSENILKDFVLVIQDKLTDETV